MAPKALLILILGILLALQLVCGFTPPAPVLELRGPVLASPSRGGRCVGSMVERKQEGVQGDAKNKNWLQEAARTASTGHARVGMEGTDCRFPPHEPCESSGRCRVDGQRCSIRHCKEEFRGNSS
mmetsp:Transcript_15964/g.36879  ORF Transcript_15964/g.36879 Transcript_15964/m.36879 type:complete len:125 (-) Transcript_15964:842-1216(-)